MGEIIIANQAFSIDAKVVNFRQPPGWDATLERCVNPGQPCANNITPYGAKAKNTGARRYAFRPQLRKYGKNPPLDATKAVIRQFVFHHDGCWSASMCWNVLHNERGLSCHFLIDNDGTIYQTIDLAFMAYHAAEYNVSSIGVEFCSRGDANKDPNAAEYRKRGLKRTTTPCKINGHTILAYEFTPQQYDAIRALARGMNRLLPNLPIEYPQELPGKQSWATMPSAFGYAGFLGHYHCTARKWDPGPFDFKTFCEKLRGSRCFPLWTGKAAPASGERPVVPEESGQFRQRVRDLYAANELQARGGFFPVGPWGEYRLWHGGVHLVGGAKQAVYAPFAGRIVAARMGQDTPTGSANFVLLRHDMSIGQSALRCFSLYMHLHDELTEKDAVALPPWMTKDGWKKAGGRGKIVLLDEPVEAGEQIGRIGLAGPRDARQPQIHFEIFATSELFASLQPHNWKVIDGSAGGRICDLESVTDPIDANHDQKLSAEELKEFNAKYSGKDGPLDDLHYRVTYCVSEWTAEPSWKDALTVAADFHALSPEQIQELVDEQITPTLWWTEEVAKHCKLPVDGVVYHYHPVNFVAFVNARILEAAQQSPDVKVDAREAKDVSTLGVVDDLGDESGESAVSDADLDERDIYENLTLEQMLDGYDGDPESP